MPDFCDLGFGQLGPAVSLASKFGRLGNALGHRVKGVVADSSRREMIWPDTWWIVTLMEDYQMSRDRAADQF